MPESRVWRYASVDRRRVPDEIECRINLVGGNVVRERHRGRMYYRLTESHFEIVDPAGAGVVGRVERGLVRRIEIGVPEGA